MKVYVEVFGCTANKSDASLIKGLINESEHELVRDLTLADSIVILTCTVIDTTEQRMLSRIKNLKKTGKPVVVAGCMASVQKDKVKSVIPEAKLLPPQYSHHIVDVLNEGSPSFRDENKTLFSKHFDDVIAPVSIAEGCMFSCSYCITSLARGKLRSFPVEEIKNDVSFAVENGCKEIQLTAQDTSSYGLDIKSNLGTLLSDVAELEGNFRIRVGMMNPFTCLKNLDSIINGFESPKIYKFLHVPVQSGDNDILEKMNRKYNVDDFQKIIDSFKERYPDITIATDIIVGFPTETDEQFQNTINLLKTVKPDITNITRFSARPFTEAKNMKGRIKTEIVKERSKLLTDFCNEISIEKNKTHVGKRYSVLITEKGKNKTFVGRSENYKPVVINYKVKIGEFLNVEITNTGPTYLVGSII
jgi:MiaB-like tRNA modifying enzyme